MSQYVPTTTESEELAASLKRLRDILHTPEALGYALVDVALTEAVTKGTRVGNRIDVPVTATIRLPKTSPLESFTETSQQVCITVFDVQIICVEVSHTTVHTPPATTAPPG